MTITDEMLRQAAPLVRDAMLASLPEPGDCEAAFSPAFRRRMRPLLRRARHPVFYRAMRQAAACFLAALVLGGGWLAVDGKAQASFLQWVRQVYETQIVYRFAGEAAENGVYRPGWVPEGYEELDASDSTVVYYSEMNGTLTFTFVPMQEGTSLYVIDTNKAVLKHVEINGLPGELYLSTDPALRNALVWLDEDNGMSLSISGFLSEADILHMAKSVYLEEPTK
ncbi:DUF4367 domain-containing protein [uncultured Dysosmobacter sp.]|uniref:DUF4367 domain-containing protein n=1 Tax=uncultured Dysosmobacter sp. TaxID=2591384 RepID=UPI00262DA4E9|nr:DUF4367 domain-containing protein [uncultured Dysosmobacter sp.]